MNSKQRRTLAALFARPVPGNIFGEVRIFHRPHPRPDTDKGAVASIRRWLEANGVEP